MRNVLEKFVEKNQNTFYVQKNLSENRAVYVIMLKNMVEPYRSQIAR
jgi:hypothetical protein